MIRSSCFWLTLVAAIFLSGCGAGSSPKSSVTTYDNQRVSTIPWNKPQKWEGSGALGTLGAGGN
jgi:uncharacterized protein YceK